MGLLEAEVVEMTVDTREKLEADIRKAAGDNIWLYRGGADYVTAKMFGWLDRQAAITERECMGEHELTAPVCAECKEGASRLRVENAELQAKVDGLTEERGELLRKAREFERTHMRLPVDADGVPIRIGDLMERTCAEEAGAFIVGLIGADGWCMDEETDFFKASECRHVQPETVEGLLEELIEDHTYKTESCTADVIKDYAERIKKAIEKKGR